MSNAIESLKQQLLDLAAAAERGELSAAAHQEAKAKLERELLDVVLAGQAPRNGSAPARLSAPWRWGMTGFVLVASVVGYALVGNPGAIQVGPGLPGVVAPQANTTADGSPPMSQAQVEAMVEKLAVKLQSEPNDADGWAMLARAYTVLGRHADAANAYKRLIALRPGDALAHANYADALAVAQGGKLTGEPATLVAKALALDANNFKALALAGSLAFDQENFKLAAELWGRAAQHAPSDNAELTEQIRNAVNEARQKAGLPPSPSSNAQGQTMGEASTAGPSEAASSGSAVAGQVVLSPAAAKQVSPEDTVFIFARAAQGPKMPLAIVRKQVKDLPIDFTLNDAMAMSPQMKLSNYPEVVIGARVSKSGQAMPQPGDWQGLSQPVKLGATAVRIEVNEVVR